MLLPLESGVKRGYGGGVVAVRTPPLQGAYVHPATGQRQPTPFTIASPDRFGVR